MINAKPIAARSLHLERPGGFRFDLPELDLAAGQSLAVLGPSGAGKSTLLDMICGVLKPTSGHLALFGQDVTALSGAQLDRLRGDRIGIIFQQHNLLPFASVRENIALPLRLSSARRKAVGGQEEAEIRRLLSAVDLDPDTYMRRAVNALSVGQQQRVAAARALIGSPSLIVADEPTSALDRDNQDRFMDLLQDLRSQSGAALIFVTHEPRLAEGFDRVLELEAA